MIQQIKHSAEKIKRETDAEKSNVRIRSIERGQVWDIGIDS
jgi:hypothetical protein